VIKIDKGKKMHRHSKYPFADMKKGESFLLPVDNVNDRKQCLRVQVPVLTAAAKLGYKIVTRKRPKEKGLRVWMVQEKDDED